MLYLKIFKLLEEGFYVLFFYVGELQAETLIEPNFCLTLVSYCQLVDKWTAKCGWLQQMAHLCRLSTAKWTSETVLKSIKTTKKCRKEIIKIRKINLSKRKLILLWCSCVSASHCPNRKCGNNIYVKLVYRHWRIYTILCSLLKCVISLNTSSSKDSCVYHINGDGSRDLGIAIKEIVLFFRYFNF